jgi:hypothetical protein
MITLNELLMGRDKTHAAELTAGIRGNLTETVTRVNAVRHALGRRLHVNSGWRPASINAATPGAAHKSNHLRGLAVDFRDHDGTLRQWCLNNLPLLVATGIWLEDFRWTPTWVHMQIVAPGSAHRIYPPSTKPPLSSGNWNGSYESRYNGRHRSYPAV